MPSYIRMKTIYLRGLLWLYLLGLGCMVLSLEPGFLDFDNLPDTNFSCVGKVIGGYYADLETNCQMFHVCTIGQLDEPMDIRFLCLNGTVFDQETRVCERIDEVDCSKSEQFYSLNLELYGNTQPSIVEENPETDLPIIIKSTTTTTTTTTTTQRPKPKTTRTQYFTTPTPTLTTASGPKVISTHLFPISNQPDIRFNPEEINISLNPGAPPNIRTKPLNFQQQLYSSSDDISHSNNKKAIVTTHISYGDEDKDDFVRVLPNSHTQRPQVSSSTHKAKYGLLRDKIQPPATPADINYSFTYHEPEDNHEYETEPPPRNYQYHTNNFRHGQYRNHFKTTTYRTIHSATTRKHPYNPHREPTTFRNPYVISLKPPSYHTSYRTEKPQRLQLPLPLLPTLPTLTFSSPAPFSLSRHIETKRYTNEHQTPPRIIISASASVSDASGRRLNYSLGTIGVTPILDEPTKSYDDYKDHDVVLDPFYHDVPKIKGKRRKRQIKHSDIIKSDQEAVDVLKFLFDWYKHQEKSTTVTIPISPDIISQINDQLTPPPISDNKVKNKGGDNNFRQSALFKRTSKFNIIGDVLSVTEKQEAAPTTTTTPASVVEYGTDDYVDDNYEALIPQENVTDKAVPKEDFTESSTKNEEVVAEEQTTTTTTTPKPKTRRRGRGKYQEKSVSEDNFGENRPKTRRGGRGGVTTEVVTRKEENETLQTTTTLEPNEEPTTDSYSEETTTAPPQYEEYEDETTTETPQTSDIPEYEEEVDEIILTTRSKETDNDTLKVTLPDKEEETPEIVVREEATFTPEDVDEEEYYEDYGTETATAEQEKEQDYVNKEIDLLTPKSIDIGVGVTLDTAAEDRIETEVIDTTVTTPLVTATAAATPLVATVTTPMVTTTAAATPLVATVTTPMVTTTAAATPMVTTTAAATPLVATVTTLRTPLVATTTTESTSAITNEKTTTELANDTTKNSEDVTVTDPGETQSTTLEHSANPSTTVENIQESTTLDLNSTNETYQITTSESVPIKEKDEISEADPEVTVTNLTPVERTTIETRLSAMRNRLQKKYYSRRTLSPRFRSSLSYKRPTARHRFSTRSFTTRPRRRKPAAEEEIIEASTSQLTTTQSLNNINEDQKEELEVGTTSLRVPISSLNSVDEDQNEEELQIGTTTSLAVSTTDLNSKKEEVVAEISTTFSSTEDVPTRPTARHRFSTQSFTTRPSRRKPAVEEEIIEALTSQLTTTQSLNNINEDQKEELEVGTTSLRIPISSLNSIDEDQNEEELQIGTTTSLAVSTTDLNSEKEAQKEEVLAEISTTSSSTEDVPTTDAPLSKSANPTQAESAKESLHTTPLSMVYKIQVRKERIRSFVFNCFGKAINRYYSDPRDCRLFHYCTSGYTKNQLLDMKFVCDLGTYYDDDKLICTKVKPERCL